MRFLGSIEAKMDAKGRVFLPATFRKVLQASGEEGLVLRRDPFEPCLAIYPESAWFAMVDTLRSRLNRWDARDQAILRQFLADATSVSLDSNGRLLIPKACLTAAAIEQDVRFVGMDDYIEIWSNSKQEAACMNPADFATALQSAMANSTHTAAAKSGSSSTVNASATND